MQFVYGGKRYERTVKMATAPESGPLHEYFLVGPPSEKIGEIHFYNDGRPYEVAPYDPSYEATLRAFHGALPALLKAVEDLARARRDGAAFDFESPVLRALPAYAREWIDEIAVDVPAHLPDKHTTRGVLLDEPGRWVLTREGFAEISTTAEGPILIPRKLQPAPDQARLVGLSVDVVLDGLVAKLASKASPSEKVRAAHKALSEAREALSKLTRPHDPPPR